MQARRTGWGHRAGIALCALAPAIVAAPAMAQGTPVFVTGAVPVSPQEYEGLPKMAQFRAYLPPSVDLTNRFPRPGYQGPQPSCSAWATTYAAQSFLIAEKVNATPDAPQLQMSPAYVYNRLRTPGSACDRGVRIVDALKLLQTEGTVPLTEFPDDISKCAVPAPRTLTDRAAAYRLSGWTTIARAKGPGVRDGITPPAPLKRDDIKGALAIGEPVVFAMPAAPDFVALRDDTVYHHETPESTNLHAMAVIGYDEQRQAFRVINSWGPTWGDHGYAWIDYDTFSLLAVEAYAMKMVARTPAPTPVLLKPVTVHHDAPDARAALRTQAAGLTCGAVTVSDVNGRLFLRGFAGDAQQYDNLHTAALAADPAVKWEVGRHLWPQCEAEMTLASALRMGDVELSVLSAQGQPLNGNPVELTTGQLFGVTAQGPARHAFLSVVYVQADGTAVELIRGREGQHQVTGGTGGMAADRYQVGNPLGDEMLIALASDQPLFGADMDGYATEREFLTGLRARLARLPAGSVSAAVVRLHTTAGNPAP